MTQFVIRNRYRRHIELSKLQLPTTVVFTTVVEDEQEQWQGQGQGQYQGHTPCLLVSIDACGDITSAACGCNGTPVVREHILFASEEVADKLLLRKAIALTHPEGEYVKDAYGDIYQVVGQTWDYQLYGVDKWGRERTLDPCTLQQA